MKKMLKFVLLSVVILAVLIVGSDLYIRSFNQYILNESEAFPSDVAVVLGTSKYTSNGQINQYYFNRVLAAAELYHQGKINQILVSGDNGTKQYNEPKNFRMDLISRGVPTECIHLDYAGFRTFDSMIRANKVFDLHEFIIISQEFHNERALFIAHSNGMQANAYNAKPVENGSKVRMFFREKLARVKAILDVYVLGTEAKYLGKKINIS